MKWVYRNRNKKWFEGTSLVAQRLRLHTSTAGGMSSILGWGTRIPRDVAKKKKERDLKESPRRECLV